MRKTPSEREREPGQAHILRPVDRPMAAFIPQSEGCASSAEDPVRPWMFPPSPSLPPSSASLSLYPRHFPLSQIVPESPIPKILHFIWMGSPPSAGQVDNARVWSEANPGFVVNFVTNTPLGLPQWITDILSSNANYGCKSDVLRYYLLYTQGGSYMDLDHAPVNPSLLTTIHDSAASGIYACVSNVMGGGGELHNGFIGSVPGHAVMKKALSAIETWWLSRTHAMPPSLGDIASFLTPSERSTAKVAFDHNDVIGATETFQKTGPGLLTNCIVEYISQELSNAAANVTILPYHVFTPILNHERGMTAEEARERAASLDTRECWLGVCGAHLWRATWIKNL